MAKERHLLTEIDEDLLIAVCSVCNTLVKVIATGVTKPDGSMYWRCKYAHRRATNDASRPWWRHKKSYCEQCGFIAMVSAQLHVDHIDGNNSNNDPENYQTLCANCHALKTYKNADWKPTQFSQSSAE